jgi:3',5'-cyclic AMP phosphodiesterase CpdA
MNKRFAGNANVFLRRRHHFRMENAEAFARQALATGARAVVFGGDFTSTATEGEFRRAHAFLEFLEAQGAQAFLVPGNHDVYTFESVRKRRFETHLEPWLPEGGYPSLSELPGGTPLVLVSTVCPNLLSTKGRITEPQVEAVASLLARAAPGPVLVVGHYPLLIQTAAYHLTPGRRLRGGDALRRALGESGREVLYAAGHVHRFSYEQDALYPNLRHLTGPPLFGHWAPAGRHGGFVQLGCRADGFDVHHHWKADEWKVETVQPGSG